MKHWSRYDKTTGLFTGEVFACNLDTPQAANKFAMGHASDTHGVIEGQHDHMCKCVDPVTLKVLDYIPDAPDSDHAWNAVTKRWELTDAARARQQQISDAQAAIQQLESTQPDLLRALALGKDGALAALQKLDTDIAAQQAIVDGTT